MAWSTTISPRTWRIKIGGRWITPRGSKVVLGFDISGIYFILHSSHILSQLTHYIDLIIRCLHDLLVPFIDFVFVLLSSSTISQNLNTPLQVLSAICIK